MLFLIMLNTFLEKLNNQVNLNNEIMILNLIFEIQILFFLTFILYEIIVQFKCLLRSLVKIFLNKTLKIEVVFVINLYKSILYLILFLFNQIIQTIQIII